MKGKLFITMLAACALITMSACVDTQDTTENLPRDTEEEQSFQIDVTVPYSYLEQQQSEEDFSQQDGQTDREEQSGQTDQSGQEEREEEAEQPEQSGQGEQQQQSAQEETAAAAYIKYIRVTADSVNIRSGPGTGYAVTGSAEKDTYYACTGETGNWYKINYLNTKAYISKNYACIFEMQASENSAVESVIEEGTRLLGTPYVYGAVRYHDGSGNLNKNFTITQFDCSSLIQYIFYKGAGVLLDVTTRTQILQGATVTKSDLQRGDLLFFTNASRYTNTGIERVGHVALYLGDNLILHTSSDYAKIEEISAQRWNYFLQAQRML